jgi:hypothetical protein
MMFVYGLIVNVLKQGFFLDFSTNVRFSSLNRLTPHEPGRISPAHSTDVPGRDGLSALGGTTALGAVL